MSTIKNFVKPFYIEIIKNKPNKNSSRNNEIIEYDSYIELEDLM
jgi:hypothetical protein